jgi:hypothetical protein
MNFTMEDQLPDFDREKVVAYLEGCPDVVVVYLFGSLARGEATVHSDVDLAVLLDARQGPREQVERQLDLMVALEAFSDRDVQVTLLNTASPLLAYEVLREGVQLYERSFEERVDFEVRAMKRYFDVKPMLGFHRGRLVRRLLGGHDERSERRAARTLEAAERVRQRFEGSAGT